MLPPPYPATFRLGQAPPGDTTSHVHWEPAVIVGGGLLTIAGLILQAKGHRQAGTLAYVSAIIMATTLAALRCYR